MRLQPILLTAFATTFCKLLRPVSGRVLIENDPFRDITRILPRGFTLPKLPDPDPVPTVPHPKPEPVVGGPTGPKPGGGGQGDNYGDPPDGPSTAPGDDFQVPIGDRELPPAFNYVPSGKQYTYKIKGRSLADELNAKISEPSPADISSGDYDRRIAQYPKVRTSGPANLNDLTEGDIGELLCSDTGVDVTQSDFTTKLQLANKDDDSASSSGSNSGSDAGADPNDEIRYTLSQAYYSPEQGTIAAHMKYSTYPDDFPLAEGDRITQSELVFHNWQAVANDRTSGLKNVYQVAIENPQPQEIIDAARSHAGSTDDHPLELFDGIDDPVLQAAFEALAGCDNGRPVFQMCIDHPDTLNKAIPNNAYVTNKPMYGMAWVLHHEV